MKDISRLLLKPASQELHRLNKWYRIDMKRLAFLLTALVATFVFFSFLAKTDISENNRISVFYDKKLPYPYVIVDDFKGKLEKKWYRVSVSEFDVREINSYIMSNRGAFYITAQPLTSKLFYLDEIDFLLVKVPVTYTGNTNLNGISGKEFDYLLKKNRLSDAEVIKKIDKHKLQVGVISFRHLNLHVKPLCVNGIFPSLENVKSGKYTKVYNAYIYTRKNDRDLNDAGFHFNCGLWIEKTFSIIAGGDIMLSRGTERNIEKYGPLYPFLNIHDEIAKYDIAVANLESPISRRGGKFFPDKGIYFRADPGVIDGLKYSGFNVFSLANNHCLDWGIDALQDTITILRDNGLKYSGVGRTREEALKPAFFTINGTKIAFISYNGIYPFEIEENPERIMKTLTCTEPDIKTEIAALKKEYDILIASVHSGIEYIHQPEPEKVRKMRTLIDYGVDVVLGSHPHVIQGVEPYKKGLIVYSLGNLIFDQKWSKETSEGMLLEIAFFKNKLLYYRPQFVYIHNTQARIIENRYSEEFLSSLSTESIQNEWVKN